MNELIEHLENMDRQQLQEDQHGGLTTPIKRSMLT